MQWFRKYWHPWGQVIAYHDEAFPVIRGTVCRISKHYTASGRFKFYTFVRRVSCQRPNKPGDRYVYRSRSLKSTLAALRRDTAAA